jgi:hypothetical protein
VTSLGPGTDTPQNTTCKEEKSFSKPSKTTPNPPRIDQQQHNQKTHGSGKSPEANPTRGLHRSESTCQTRNAWAARDEQHPRVKSPKSNSRSPNSLHGFAHDFGDSRNTSWALHRQVMVHQNSLNQEESKDFGQEHH